MPTDHFPPTLSTWIVDGWDAGPERRAEVNQKLMDTYRRPLTIYYLGSSYRRMGEPDDIVNGFFADRLAREDFIPKWHTSGIRLRRWLMNALIFYLREQIKKRPRAGIEAPATDFASDSGDPERDAERAAASEFVRQAALEAERRCVESGLGEHWRAFVRHHVDGDPFSEVAVELDVNEARAHVMARTAGRKFKAALREVLGRDGVEEDEMDQEIKSLLETME